MILIQIHVFIQIFLGPNRFVCICGTCASHFWFQIYSSDTLTSKSSLILTPQRCLWFCVGFQILNGHFFFFYLFALISTVRREYNHIGMGRQCVLFNTKRCCIIFFPSTFLCRFFSWCFTRLVFILIDQHYYNSWRLLLWSVHVYAYVLNFQ